MNLIKLLAAFLLLFPGWSYAGPRYLAKVSRTVQIYNVSFVSSEFWVESDDGILSWDQEVEGHGNTTAWHFTKLTDSIVLYVRGNPNGSFPYRRMHSFVGELRGSKQIKNIQFLAYSDANAWSYTNCSGNPSMICAGSSVTSIEKYKFFNQLSSFSGTASSVAENTPYSVGGVKYYRINNPGIPRVSGEDRTRTTGPATPSATDPHTKASTKVTFYVATSPLPQRKREPGNVPGPKEEYSCAGGGNGASGPGGGSQDSLASIRHNIATGNVLFTMNDPVSTRGYPLTSRIHLNSQAVELTRPMGNATFTYDIHVTTQTLPLSGGGTASHWVLVDGDGQRLNFGPSASDPAPEAGVFSTLTQTLTGFELTAGPPENLRRAGNYFYEFDSGGKLLSITDPAGNVQTLTYSSGKLTSVLDVNSNKEITYSYTGDRITQVTENGGGADTYITYSSDRVTKIELKEGGTANLTMDFTYDGSNRLATIKRDGSDDSVYSISYRTQSSVEPGESVYLANISWNSGAATTAYNMDSPGHATRVIQRAANGGLTSYDFDADRNLKKVTLPPVEGATQPVEYTYTHDANKNVTSINDGSVTTTFSYNANGTLDRITQPEGYYRQYNYDGVNLTSVEDSLGIIKSYTYGNMSLPNTPTAEEDAEGNEWSFTHNAYGQITQITPPAGSPSGALAFTYDENVMSSSYGWLKEIEDGEGNLQTFDSYNLLGDVTSYSTYVDPGDPGTQKSTTFTYDAAHRVKVMTHPDSKTVTNSYSGGALSYTDDEAAKRTNYTWCADCGALSGITKALGWGVGWTRDAGRLISKFKDALNNETSYTYGAAGELTGINYPDSTTEEYSYDNSARLSKITNGRGENIEIAYDSVGRIAEVSFPTTSDPTISFSYRADSLKEEVEDAAGTTSYEYYDNRLLKAIEYDYSDNGLTNVQRVEYTYNPDDSIDTIIWKDGGSTVATWTYGYDSAGRMNSVSAFSETTGYTYDGQDKLLSQTNANGTTVQFTYNDDRGWPTTIKHVEGLNTLAEYDLEYDGGSNTVGNLTRVDEAPGDYVTYTYDDLHRLTSETRTGTGAFANSFVYDLSGNLTTLNSTAFAGYDSANKVSSIPSGSISHDGDGNVTAVSGVGITSSTFTWDSRNKMTSQTTGGVVTGYGYDASGKRVWSQVDSDPRRFYIFAGETLIGEIDGSTPSVAYTWGANGLISKRDIPGGESLWYHYGPQGETRFLTDDNADITSSYAYDAYGITLSSSGSDMNPFKYGGRVGYYTDGGAGLILAGARWYSPQLKRWVSRDPIRYKGGFNLYNYVDSNPIMYFDWTGRLPVRNETGIVLPYKPEGEDNVIRFCSPGQTCDMDGYFHPKYPPRKVRDTCLGEPALDINCVLSGWCVPFISHLDLDPNFFQKHTDWPNPFTGRNGWQDSLPLKEGP